MAESRKRSVTGEQRGAHEPAQHRSEPVQIRTDRSVPRRREDSAAAAAQSEELDLFEYYERHQPQPQQHTTSSGIEHLWRRHLGGGGLPFARQVSGTEMYKKG